MVYLWKGDAYTFLTFLPFSPTSPKNASKGLFVCLFIVGEMGIDGIYASLITHWIEKKDYLKFWFLVEFELLY